MAGTSGDQRKVHPLGRVVDRDHMAISSNSSKFVVWLLLGSLGFAGAHSAGCSPKFHSCYETRTCPKANPEAGAAGDVSDGSSGAATASAGAGQPSYGGAAMQQQEAGAAGENSGGTAGKDSGGGSGESSGGAPPDPCAGKTCDSPPDNDCESSTKFRAYDRQGSCSAGVCSYASQQISCTCQQGACTTDPCLSVTCASSPAQKCKDASTLTQYASSGTCNGGSCSYAASDSSCAFGCANGACKADPCLSMTCTTQKAAICKDATTKTTFAATGSCSAGTCNYPSTDVSCGGSNLGCSGAGVCGVCKSDSSCGASCGACPTSARRCKDLGSTSKCVECLVDTDCSPGVCEWSLNSCRPPLNGCNTLTQIGPTVTAVSASGTMPAGTRGTFAAGTYVLAGTQRFGTAEAPPEGQTLTVAVNGSQVTLNSYENLGDMQLRWTGIFYTNSVPPVFTYTCGAPSSDFQLNDPMPVDYTVVNGTTFWLLYPTDPGSGVKYIFTKQ